MVQVPGVSAGGDMLDEPRRANPGTIWDGDPLRYL
jgi:hypothetical protein